MFGTVLVRTMPQHWPSHPAAQNNAKLPQVWRYNTRLVHYYNIRLCKWIPFFIPHTTCCNSHDAGSRPIKIQHRIWPQFYRVRGCRVVKCDVMVYIGAGSRYDVITWLLLVTPRPGLIAETGEVFAVPLQNLIFNMKLQCPAQPSHTAYNGCNAVASLVHCLDSWG